MEILQFLISLLKDNQSIQKLAPIIQILQQNNFDLKSTLSSINPQVLAPFIQQFMQSMQKESPTEFVGQQNALSPISDIADKEVIYSLNKYLSQDTVSF